MEYVVQNIYGNLVYIPTVSIKQKTILNGYSINLVFPPGSDGKPKINRINRHVSLFVVLELVNILEKNV